MCDQTRDLLAPHILASFFAKSDQLWTADHIFRILSGQNELCAQHFDQALLHLLLEKAIEFANLQDPAGVSPDVIRRSPLRKSATPTTPESAPSKTLEREKE